MLMRFPHIHLYEINGIPDAYKGIERCQHLFCKPSVYCYTESYSIDLCGFNANNASEMRHSYPVIVEQLHEVGFSLKHCPAPPY
ncbi:hypothetical protein KSC_081910 [Ktedonobacter sp. SOSP1-52]|nr:hypothetical protein KSC_081910 [Ktedonobacter sp. SOSP1-52]